MAFSDGNGHFNVVNKTVPDFPGWANNSNNSNAKIMSGVFTWRSLGE